MVPWRPGNAPAFQVEAPEERRARATAGALPVTIYQPDGPGPFPFAVLLHGCGGLQREAMWTAWVEPWARLFREHGIGTAVVDSFGPRGVESTTPTAPSTAQIAAPPPPPAPAPSASQTAAPKAVAPKPPVSSAVATKPTASDVEASNVQARAHAGDKTLEVIKDAAIGGAIGAGVGAAGGAVASGGKGAGKGAGIGGVVGLAAGTLYGLNENKANDARYVEAYRACMKNRGYVG